MSFTELSIESLKTPDGLNSLNSMLNTLFRLVPGDGENLRIFHGYGTPESSVTAPIGSLYMRKDGSTDTTLYRKESGTGDTGWVAITNTSLDYKVKVSSNDTTENYLLNKLAAGSGVTLTETNDGGDEDVTIAIGTGNSSLAPSNVLWSFGLCQTSSSGGSQDRGISYFSGTTPTLANVGTYAWVTENTTYKTALRTKFKKIAGIDTVTWYAFVNSSDNNYAAYCQLIIDSLSSAASTSSSHATQTWITNTIDVSSLTDGSVYDVYIELKNASTLITAMYYFVAFGS